ncbi:ATP-binding response regulator [Mesorhizobium retamae]|uniref:histidine kinase n=1 Tax=Mesorhizobium retamae TaxID=2912854 RepID=A0ABS9QDW2_9HYPH|nr:hybrid sensor histidine kinase/response regulator [Mesorhizobium sp. IRAMC:0171]MCG7505606.1 ATP-binding protein [Mesorhizobium sp. IRAMC:0171]
MVKKRDTDLQSARTGGAPEAGESESHDAEHSQPVARIVLVPVLAICSWIAVWLDKLATSYANGLAAYYFAIRPVERAMFKRRDSAGLPPARITSTAEIREQESYDAERSQAVVRLVFVPILASYIWIVALLDNAATSYANGFAAYYFAYVPVSWLLLWWVVAKPVVYKPRRLVSMAFDYIAFFSAMSIGGAALLPLYAALLWVTVGNGLRFGARYLVVSTGLALLSIAATTYFNAFWWDNPYVTLTLVMTTILVPAYIYALLQKVYEAYDAAHEANLAKSRFLAQASHDLRQPIHAISLFTACLRDTGLDREQKQMVENIDRSLHSVSGLFRSLLDISTLDSGKVTPHFEVVAVQDIIDEVLAQNASRAQWSNTTFRLVRTRLHVRTDAALLTTIVQNIVSNALKYAPGSEVLIGCRRHRYGLSIEIHDRGEGIAAEHLPRLFDEFYQVRERGDKDVEGVGLGLAIVKRLANLMSLRVSIRSVKGQGSSVRIAGLPVVSAPEQTRKIAPERFASPLEGLRVLLVEDDEDVLLATASLLEKWGCIVQAGTGTELSASPCDLIVTDFDLGSGVVGADFIRAVRRQAGRDIPAIVMTGHDENRVREELGHDDIPILSKPVRPSELRSTMIALSLGRARRAQTPSLLKAF